MGEQHIGERAVRRLRTAVYLPDMKNALVTGKDLSREAGYGVPAGKEETLLAPVRGEGASH
jgi:hypothetical protein